MGRKNIFLILLIAGVSLFTFYQPLNAQTAVSSPEVISPQPETIEISPMETIITVAEPVCNAPCYKSGETCACPVEPSCEQPCAREGNTCVCPLTPAKTCKVGCTCDDETMTCPPQEPICNPPCLLSGNTCSCPTEPIKNCPINCTCEGETITCRTLETKPIEAKIASIESGMSIASIEKSANELSIKTPRGQAITKEKLLVTKDGLAIQTSGGSREIKILPEEASLKAKDLTSLKEVRLEAEAIRVVYSISGIKQAKILFLFPVEYGTVTKVDAQTGQVVSVSKPWWTLLVL